MFAKYIHWGTALHILNLSTRWWVISFTPRPLYLSSGLYRRLGGLQSWSGHIGEGKNSHHCPFWELKPGRTARSLVCILREQHRLHYFLFWVELISPWILKRNIMPFAWISSTAIWQYLAIYTFSALLLLLLLLIPNRGKAKLPVPTSFFMKFMSNINNSSAQSMGLWLSSRVMGLPPLGLSTCPVFCRG